MTKLNKHLISSGNYSVRATNEYGEGLYELIAAKLEPGNTYKLNINFIAYGDSTETKFKAIEFGRYDNDLGDWGTSKYIRYEPITSTVDTNSFYGFQGAGAIPYPTITIELDTYLSQVEYDWFNTFYKPGVWSNASN